MKWLVVWIGFLCGCTPATECSLGEARCNGTVAENCNMHSPEHDTAYVWQGMNCGVDSPYELAPFCLILEKKEEGRKVAHCVTKKEPIPECEGSGVRHVCSDGQYYKCLLEGYGRQIKAPCP